MKPHSKTIENDPAELHTECGLDLAAESRGILIGNCPSSGSTLLSVMLDAHPHLQCGPELQLFAHPFFWDLDGEELRERLLSIVIPSDSKAKQQIEKTPHRLASGWSPYVHSVVSSNLTWYGRSLEDLVDAIKTDGDPRANLLRCLYGAWLESDATHCWAEKSPPNLYAIPSFLKRYPDARAVVLVRDGRDVVASLRARGFALGTAISIWGLETALALVLRQNARVSLVRYEDLVTSPERTLKQLCEELGVKAHVKEMVAYRDYSDRVKNDVTLSKSPTWQANPKQGLLATNIGRWKEELTKEELWLFYQFAFDDDMPKIPSFGDWPTFTAAQLLEELDYDPGCTPALSRSDQVITLSQEPRILKDIFKKHSFQSNWFLFNKDKIPKKLNHSEIEKLLKAISRYDEKEKELNLAKKQINILRNK